MPIDETLETVKYFFTEASKLPLAYIVLMRYHPLMDIEYEPGKKRATLHNVLEIYRPYITHPATRVFLNCGLTGEEAAKLVEEGKIDGGAFGILALLHPDIAKRIKYGKPLDNNPDFPAMQIGIGEDPEKLEVGYTDYAEAEYDESDI